MCFFTLYVVLSLLVCFGCSVHHIEHLDSYYPNKYLQKIGFGSCSKTKYPLKYLETLVKYPPDLWLWTGDIVYGKTKHCTDLSHIISNYQILV